MTTERAVKVGVGGDREGGGIGDRQYRGGGGDIHKIKGLTLLC